MDILILNKVHFRAKKFTTPPKEYYIIITGSIYQEDIAILNMYAPNNRAAKIYEAS